MSCLPLPAWQGLSLRLCSGLALGAVLSLQALAQALLPNPATPGGAAASAVPRISSPSPGTPEGPERLAWTALRGSAVDLSVGVDGTTLSVDSQGLVWRRLPGPDAPWMKLPGAFVRVDVATERQAVAVSPEGAVYHFNGTAWRLLPSPAAVDVSVAFNSASGAGLGPMALVSSDGQLHTWSAQTGFAPVPGAPAPLKRVDLDDQGLPWVVLRDGGVQRFDGREWQRLPGRAHDVSAGLRGAAFTVEDSSRQPARWNAALRTWVPLLARADVVASSPNNRPWIVTPEGLIFTNDVGSQLAGNRPRPGGSPFVQSYTWQLVLGSARSLAISARGEVMALGRTGDVWQWRGRGGWGPLPRPPGSFDRLALAPSGVPIAVADDRQIYTLRGSAWVLMPGRALDVSITPQGVAWALLTDGSPAYLSPQGTWVSINAPGDAVRMAVGPSSRPWVVSREGAVRSHDGSGWVEHEGFVASDIAIGPEGTVFAVGPDRRVVRYDTLSRRWDRVDIEASAIAAGPRDRPWVVLADGAIRASSLFETTETVGGDCSAAVGQTPLKVKAEDFQRVRGNVAARDVAIGKDGNVFISDSNSNLQQWRNSSESFRSFPGQFAQVAVAPNGSPWGVTVSGEVWRHDGSKWLLIRSANLVARDIAIGCNGTVIVADREERLHRYIPLGNTFRPILGARADEAAPTGRRVAVDPQGNPWVIRNDTVFRCEDGLCERQAMRAKEIAIGPEGTLMVVDLDGQLQAFDARNNTWQRLGLSAETLAIGPDGFPWLVRNGTEVWRSGLFKRDEAQDDARANGTLASASNSAAPPPFTFNIAMAFDQVALPAGFVAPGEIHLAFSPSGQLVVKDGAFQFWGYDDARRTLVRDFTVPNPNVPAVLNGDALRAFFIGTDGTYWITNAGLVPRIWRRAGAQWVQVPITADCPTTPGCAFPSPLSVNIAPDGTVYATSEGNALYRYDSLQQRFVLFTGVPRPPGGAGFVALDPAGRIWIASPGAGSLFEYVNNNWVRRSDAVIGAPGQCFFSATPCVSFAGTGTAFGLGAIGKPVRWNPGSGVWELISTAPQVGDGTYIGAPDGRPWLWTGPAFGIPPSSLFRGR